MPCSRQTFVMISAAVGGGQLEIRNVAVVQVEVGDVLLDVEVDLGAVVQLGVRGEDARVDRAG